MSHSKIILKKYPNRRIYDTENSRYVTLEGVAELIRQGHQIEVIDLRTHQDITAFILTQIIMEQARKNNVLLPVSLLHLVIRSGENTLGEFFENYLEQTIQSYLKYKKNMEEQLRLCLELGIDFSAMAEKTMKQLSPFQNFLGASPDEEKKNK
ncbi:polyhydroxyalkanoate synthesis repressor PhaR [Desulfonema ishimotonii]|uniref:Polyhydroxyalkanoate synthesis repressor PhaR n=1 Tax=Desulfonema ishimotonii TaxID=45657 RepID=A0A401G303_9BACT|nr:polyhydroxyalkanoate synthesis repressor PhaR [Desulfonema ishimotonii]GBC63604.1 polyhydroxyalkanoate synthesis repressor PhaR [Desulfonema ishimotonii]